MRFDPSRQAAGPEQGLVLRLRASRGAVVLLALMVVLALLAVSLSGLAQPVKMALWLLILGFALATSVQHYRHGPRRILLGDKGMTVETAATRRASISACRSVFLSPWYVGFAGLDERGQVLRRVAVFRDQLDREAYRQLCAWFRKRED